MNLTHVKQQQTSCSFQCMTQRMLRKYIAVKTLNSILQNVNTRCPIGVLLPGFCFQLTAKRGRKMAAPL